MLHPIILKTLELMPKIRRILPVVVNFMAVSGNAEQVEVGKTLQEVSTEIPDDAVLAAIMRKSNAFNVTNREHLLVPNTKFSRSIEEFLTAWNYLMLSAVFGSSTATTYMETLACPPLQSFLKRNEEKLLAVTFESFMVAMTIFNNQIKPKVVNQKMTVCFTVMSQVANASSKLDLAQGKSRMLAPVNMIKGMNDPNFFFSGKTAEEKENSGYFTQFLDMFDWFEKKMGDFLTGTASIVANEDVSHTIDFVDLDNTANDYVFNPDNDGDLHTSLDYVFFTILKIKLK